VTNERQIYLLNPKEFSPETIAVAFAKTSRSPESFREIAHGLNNEKSADFHEKWVVGYGHSSVAEHAVLHLAIENVSRLAVESIESNRLASYTEKSTRYQKWSPTAFLTPAEVFNAGLMNEYNEVCSSLFGAYIRSLELCKKVVQQNCPRQPDETDTAWERRIRSQYVDVCRFILPAASLANLGMTVNARVLEGMLRKMLSNPLQEVREVGEQIKSVAIQEIPTLVKYADIVPYLVETPQKLKNDAHSMKVESNYGQDWCQLIDWQADGEDRIIAAALYRVCGAPYKNILNSVKHYTLEEKNRVLDHLLGKAGKFDSPLRELEHITYTFDIVMDQGAYFEIKRHRMMTQTPQELSCGLGYAVPSMLKTAGYYDEYCELMNGLEKKYHKFETIISNAAAYIVPNGYNRRVLMTLNFREAYQLCALRSAPNAHFSARRVAQKMADQIRSVHPSLGKYIKVNSSESWKSVEQDNFIIV
jgi:thymidylate synthase ThyX